MACVATLITATAVRTRLSMSRVKRKRTIVMASATCAQYFNTSWLSSDGSVYPSRFSPMSSPT